MITLGGKVNTRRKFKKQLFVSGKFLNYYSMRTYEEDILMLFGCR